jgi:hypothetical protein
MEKSGAGLSHSSAAGNERTLNPGECRMLKVFILSVAIRYRCHSIFNIQSSTFLMTAGPGAILVL